MALLTVEKIVDTGLNPNLVAADVGGDTFKNQTASRTFIYVDNASGAPITVTVTAQTTSAVTSGLGKTTKADSITSVTNAQFRLIGPFPAVAFNDGTGTVSITYSAVTSVTVAVIEVPSDLAQ